MRSMIVDTRVRPGGELRTNNHYLVVPRINLAKDWCKRIKTKCMGRVNSARSQSPPNSRIEGTTLEGELRMIKKRRTLRKAWLKWSNSSRSPATPISQVLPAS